MDPETSLAELRDFCAERLRADLAERVAGLVRPGFELVPAASGQAAGHSRFGGNAMLEPGVPWPRCEGLPLSLLAVLDTDALPPWLDGILPPGTGLLNFFHLDIESDQADPAAWDVTRRAGHCAPELGQVVAARSGLAVETEPPATAGVFAPVAWAAMPGFVFPDLFDSAWDAIDPEFGPDYDDVEVFKHEMLTEFWVPGSLLSEDMAFGRPVYPTGGGPVLPDGEDLEGHHHLLQLSDKHEWHIDGDGGWMHWSIPTHALRVGDFTQAIPTPDVW
ncbi:MULTISPECIES: DUF1963 domain-containing protein [unclassified Streptomyces]|uniref:DUF1963 domain-containing protein n=1 Tax=unclassified Streptomyces TaxID=2593676 RepID=UPI002DD8CCD9|nr:DUF1963 domain-containing protein [Streptomyces sp. NBC_01775]WSB77878.1 YwqG family protein [Streptomyces sp. NBC_01775]WSS42689.1 YwqG family protein [Streptomyces sp. NBC_01187]